MPPMVAARKTHRPPGVDRGVRVEELSRYGESVGGVVCPPVRPWGDSTAFGEPGDRYQGPTWNDTSPPAIPWPKPIVSVTPEGRTRLKAFDQFVVKLHSRCNLACDYCYVYELQDTGWRERPRTMPEAVRERLLERIAEHVRQHRPSHVQVALHGGEPLLAGRDVIARFSVAARRVVAAAGAEAEIVLQTNGVLLDEPTLETLLRQGIRVGVSLDGDERSHDRHRRGPAGGRHRGSHARVTAGLARLTGPRYRHLFAGLLCVVDPAAGDAADVFDALVGHAPPAVDFLLPYGSWDHPAPGAGSGAYGRWLCAAFDRWWASGRPTQVRLFESIMAECQYGAGSSSEVIGTLPAAAVVVESDGSITWAGSLNAVADGAAQTGGTIFSHSFDAVLSLPGAPEHGVAALCRTCRECPLVTVCGAGLRAHRHGRGRGFANPSVYCRDLSLLIRHIQARVKGS
ncbi:FxsB family cyclophane-forming radical SAM/SPASM peptide maturase [Streptomyces justiciae]|uniref:FxsB family cyclophane-forming radical SAM/SPASM peptide maturase n=1 Tax=Streptomyces justiciae TaxID=2780140 RepID=UPI002ADE5D6D|nr:FxsB family cyclophane-forming radical SAM/SPASM peptide maturase [Streptomyces justiciae]